MKTIPYQIMVTIDITIGDITKLCQLLAAMTLTFRRLFRVAFIFCDFCTVRP